MKLLAAMVLLAAIQKYTDLEGTVRDSRGTPIPGVTITATDSKTGIKTTRISLRNGTFTIPRLAEGNYTVTANLPGFETAAYADVPLGTQTIAVLDFTLKVAERTR